MSIWDLTTNAYVHIPLLTQTWQSYWWPKAACGILPTPLQPLQIIFIIVPQSVYVQKTYRSRLLNPMPVAQNVARGWVSIGQHKEVRKLIYYYKNREH